MAAGASILAVGLKDLIEPVIGGIHPVFLILVGLGIIGFLTGRIKIPEV